MKRPSLLIACWLLFAGQLFAQTQHLVTDELIWIEGEQPDPAKVEFDITPSARPQLLSDGKMLTRTLAKNQIPEYPWQLNYSFDVKRADQYAFWIRLGFEWVRAPFEWKLDDGPWQKAMADVQTTQVMELATWNEIAWAYYGDVKLTSGRHTLTMRFSEGGLDGRQMVAIDCIALGRLGFDPAHMYHIARQPIDQQAAEQVYRFENNPVAPSMSMQAQLTGLWQIARFDDPDMDVDTYEPITQLPDTSTLRWLGLNVPGKGRGAWAQRDELSFGHRLLYQTRVDIPASSNQSFQMHFDATNWIVSVFINGKLATTHKSVLVPWSVDVTPFIEPGRINTLVVAVKSPWYAIDVKAQKGRTSSLDRARNTPDDENFAKNRSYVAPVYPSTKGQGNGLVTGIIGPVTLVQSPGVYVEDVFVQTRVTPTQQLTAQVILHNATNKVCNVQWQGHIVNQAAPLPHPALQFTAAIEPGQSRTITAGPIDVPDARLWWPEAHAQLYQLNSQLTYDGAIRHIAEQTFGFREVSIKGKDFLVNGIPWHFWNWVDVPEHMDVNHWLKTYHAQSDRFHRIASDHDQLFGSREKALDFFDANGIPGRLSTCIDGMFITHDLNNPLVWENFQEHVAQVVKAYRNHPSIMMYSLGNEMFFVTAFLRHWNNYREMEQHAAKLHAIAKELDPTRASFQDGGGDLGGLGEINCQHYTFPKGGSFPLAAYDYPVGKPNGDHTREEAFKWSGNNPLVLGEVFYYSGNLSGMAWVGGPSVYRGKSDADVAAGKYLNIAMQGARWQGVTAICPWTAQLPGCKAAFAPRAVFMKEHNSNVYPNSQFARTIKLFNDTRFDDPMQMTWQLLSNGTVIGQGSKTYNIAAGHSEEDTLTIPTPQVLGDMDVTLRLMLAVNGQTVFSDDHLLHVLFPEQIKPQPSLEVIDPSGNVIKWLKKKHIPYLGNNNAGLIVKSATGPHTVLIGPNALDQMDNQAKTFLINRIKSGDAAYIVLEQSNPVTGKELGIDLELANQKHDAGKVAREEFEGAKGNIGQIAFIASPAHAVFKDMNNDQFFTWADGSYNFTNSYAMPSSGMLPLISAGNDLNLSPMVLINKGGKQFVLSQMLIGGKLGIEPMADRLLTRLLNEVSQAHSQPAARTAVLTDGDSQLDQLLKQTGLQYDSANTIADLLKRAPTHKVMVIKASAQNMAWLRTNKALIETWASGGGKMMLVNLTDTGIKDFDQLVGFPHVIRPGTRERVRLDNLANPLLLGISDRDIAMDADEFIARWRNQRYISDRVFTNVIDGVEVASFAKVNGKYSNMFNGLTNADFWRYICYLDPTETIHMQFAYPQKLERMQLWTNSTYQVIKRLRLIFDSNRATAMNIDLADTPDMQVIPLNGQPAQTLDIQLLEMFDKPSSKPITGIDNLEIYRSLPDDMAAKFDMLSTPGGLVEYPLGNGCLLLNNLDYQKPDTDVNRKKKLGLWSNLLRNMGASMNTAN